VAIALLWFVTIHPFEDGSGRIGRALADMSLARSENSPQRFYSVAGEIRRERPHYYATLEQTQKGDLDITERLLWFVGCFSRAIDAAEEAGRGVLCKADFWQRHALTPLNERQRKVLNRFLDGFEGKLTAQKWKALANARYRQHSARSKTSTIAGCSSATRGAARIRAIGSRRLRTKKSRSRHGARTWHARRIINPAVDHLAVAPGLEAVAAAARSNGVDNLDFLTSPGRRPTACRGSSICTASNRRD
jgi:hypothetical protein